MIKNSIFLFPTHPDEIKIIIKLLKNDTAAGIDEIPTSVLKKLSNFIIKPLANIINICLETGVCPDHCKKAIIIPVHKAKEKYFEFNYRPISLISNVAKIFEKVVHKRLLSFLNKYNVLNKNQYGFRQGKSTKDALAHFAEYIYKNLDNSKPIIAIFLDLAKAFDTVDHKILIQKLSDIGIRGIALNLIKNYLTGRTQCVKVDGIVSSETIVDIGVPQGTVLGPLLFLIYINEIYSAVQFSQKNPHNIISYADDTTILISGDTWEDAELNANLIANKIFTWMCQNKLSVNINKTVFLTFGVYKDSVPANINIFMHNHDSKSKCNCIPITRVESTKYLGILIDYKLKWDFQINYLIKRNRYLIFVFAKLKYILNKEQLLTIYYALFESVTSYGIVAWGDAYKSELNRIELVQNKILKIIFKSKQNSITDNSLKINNILSIKKLFYFTALTLSVSVVTVANHLFFIFFTTVADIYVFNFARILIIASF